jgi:hypothetical protein
MRCSAAEVDVALRTALVVDREDVVRVAVDMLEALPDDREAERACHGVFFGHRDDEHRCLVRLPVARFEDRLDDAPSDEEMMLGARGVAELPTRDGRDHVRVDVEVVLLERALRERARGLRVVSRERLEERLRRAARRAIAVESHVEAPQAVEVDSRIGLLYPRDHRVEVLALRRLGRRRGRRGDREDGHEGGGEHTMHRDT